MKQLVFATLLLQPCDQKIYDLIYKQIALETLKRPITKAEYDQRNDSIEMLRALCRGQKSSYEVHQ